MCWSAYAEADRRMEGRITLSKERGALPTSVVQHMCNVHAVLYMMYCRQLSLVARAPH